MFVGVSFTKAYYCGKVTKKVGHNTSLAPNF